jgi:hypothetical protein
MFSLVIKGYSESALLIHISPERGKYISPGQRPGDRIAVIFEALKGHNRSIVIHIYFALSGLYYRTNLTTQGVALC